MSAKFDVNMDSLDAGTKMLVAKYLMEHLEAEALEMEADQILAAQQNQADQRSIDGVGSQVLAMSPAAFVHYKVNEQLDFSNPRDIAWLHNRYPETRVRSVGTKLQVGWTRGNVRSTQRFNL